MSTEHRRIHGYETIPIHRADLDDAWRADGLLREAQRERATADERVRVLRRRARLRVLLTAALCGLAGGLVGGTIVYLVLRLAEQW